MFLSCRPFVVTTTLSTGLVETKGLQDRNIHITDGMTVENKGKLILTIARTLGGVLEKFHRWNIIKLWLCLP